MAGDRAVLMATDPPYLVDYDGSNHLTTKGGVHAQPAGLASEWDKYQDHESGITFYRDFIMAARQEALTDNPAVYQWFAGMRADIVFAAWREAGLLPHQLMIWKKSRGILTHAHYLWDYEPFMYGWVQGHMPSMRPPAGATATWEVGSAIEDNPGAVHPTMKPVELIRRCIDHHTKPGQLIYEPFSGSGTALIAAEETGRRCHAIELSPAFVDVAVQRWERFSGKQATLEGDGRSHAELAEERCG
jgi:DNA modification methylase